MYIRALSLEKFMEICRPFMQARGLSTEDSRFRMIAPLVQERVKILSEVAPMVEFLFTESIERDLSAMYQKGIDATIAKELLSTGLERLKGLSDFSVTSVDGELRKLAEERGLKAGPAFGVFRIAVTGKKITPPLFESMVALGKESSLKRIEEACRLL